MHFVNRHGGLERIAAGARIHPCAITEFVTRFVNERGGGGRRLHLLHERVALQQQVSGAGSDFKFIKRSGLDSRNEQLPDSRIAERAHHVDASVPSIEAPDHTYAGGIRSPYCECHSADAADFHRMSTELVPGAMMPLLDPQKEIKITE